jgi:sulfate adenylyltransferase
MTTSLIEPHGGELCNLFVSEERKKELKSLLINHESWTLTDRQVCDLELILNGGFSPLKGFLNKNDYDSVLISGKLSRGDKLVLRDKEGFPLAILHIEDIWEPDLKAEAQSVFGTVDETHPAANYLLNFTNSVYIGGALEGMTAPKHYDYQGLRQTPSELREQFVKHGWENIVAFQTRNPMHRAHVELTMRAANEIGANVLIHPVVGLTKPGDVDHYTRVRCYEKVLPKYPKGTVILSLLPLAMRMGGPREALWHAIIRKNYGCNFLIVGRDHAGPGKDQEGNPFYGPYDAQDLLREYEAELGIKMVPFKLMVYMEDHAEYHPMDEVPEDAKILSISGTELRRRLDKGLEIPEWFSYPEVVEELRETRPPLNKRGFSIFFTGLSGSGKSTLANGLMVKLLEDGRRPVTLLDGDVVRNFGIAICAPIAPYKADRQVVRKIISHYGGFIEVFVNTSLEVCERRDVKGLYAKARQGILKEFTGISDPYEEPENAEIVINSEGTDPEILVQDILLKIEQLGYI